MYQDSFVWAANGPALPPQSARVLFDPGATVFRQGEFGDTAYLIERGHVEISKTGDSGKDVVALLGPGEIFGEIAPIDGQVRTATATALHESVLVPITEEQLEDALAETNPLAQLILRAAIGRLRAAQSADVGSGPSGNIQPANRYPEDKYRITRDKASEHIRLRSELAQAIEAREFYLLFQPIVDLQDGRTAGFETLIRWLTSDGRQLLPGDFIPLAELSGLIQPLGQWVLETALNCVGRMHQRQERIGRRAAPVFISVNVSPRQLETRANVEQLASTIEDSGINPEHIKLEITEQSLLADPTGATASLSRLKSTGAQISIDDFGTGYSSLSYLHRFPLDSLKIDQSFISTIAGNEGGERVAAAIIGLAHELGMDVIAEGIEKANQYRWLQNKGCRFGQGFLMANPLPFDEAVLQLEREFELQE